MLHEQLAGEVLNKYKMAKHFDVTITAASLNVQRKQDQIAEEARLDGIYVIRTPLPAVELGRRKPSRPTRTSSTWNATSATSKQTTSTWIQGPAVTDSAALAEVARHSPIGAGEAVVKVSPVMKSFVMEAVDGTYERGRQGPGPHPRRG